MRLIDFIFLLAVSGCDQSIGDPAPPDDCVDGPAALPLNCTSEPTLTASNVPSWLGFYLCSNSTQVPQEQTALDATRGDATILDAFFAVVDQTWTFDGTTASCTDAQATWAALTAIRALRDPNAFARLDALVWRPLPTPTFELEADEYQAAQALACIQTPEAQAEAQNIATTHPSPLVRELTANTLQSQKCSLADF